MKFHSPYLIKPHSKIKLSAISSSQHHGVADKDAAEPILATRRTQLDQLQDVFYAAQTKAMLIVLQGMDTAGKDGTIRHIFSGINPQGCDVASFKVPTTLEVKHDFLWRCHAQVPARGMIEIFNRSHYEDVLFPRVHGQISTKEARRRMDDINTWEQSLANNDVIVLKFFLHISKEEQLKRFEARAADPYKHWKISEEDWRNRKKWKEHIEAAEEMFERTSTKFAPWHLIESEFKYYARLKVLKTVVKKFTQEFGE